MAIEITPNEAAIVAKFSGQEHLIDWRKLFMGQYHQVAALSQRLLIADERLDTAASEREETLAGYLDDPEVWCLLPAPHRKRLTELLHGKDRCGQLMDEAGDVAEVVKRNQMPRMRELLHADDDLNG